MGCRAGALTAPPCIAAVVIDLEDLQVHRRRLAVTAGLGLERDLLSFVEVAEASAFNGRDMHEHVVATGIRLNEAEALLGIEPLDGALSHEKSSLFGVERPSCGQV